MKLRMCTWPPEKPTATTPSSLPADRNLGEIVEGEVIVVFQSRSNVEGRLCGRFFSRVENDVKEYIPRSNDFETKQEGKRQKK